MIANIIDPASQDSPDGLENVTLIHSVRTTSPKKPYTTEGIPARSSTDGFTILLVFFGISSDMNKAHPNPMGSEKRIARKVTKIEPTIRGKAPNKGFSFVGCHEVPRIKFIGCSKADAPSKKRKIVIRITNAVEAEAEQNKRVFTM